MALTRVRLDDRGAAPARQEAKRRINLMVDSGAFSAWQSGTKVDLKAYMAWLKQHKSRLFSYVALDVLPEEKLGAAATPDDCAKASDINLQRMLDAGLRPIPVFHQHEPFKWLVKMVEDGHDYIGLGGSAYVSLKKREAWFNEVFTLLCDKQGRPCVKTHGFGVGAPELVWNYPFYTVDSTTWVIGGAAYGRIVMPHAEKLGATADLYVGRATRGPQHIGILNTQLEAVEQHLANAKVERSDLTESYIARAKVMALVIKDLADRRAAEPCRFTRWTARISDNSLIEGKARIKALDLPPIERFDLKIFNVAWGNVMNHILNVTNHDNRLMSYLNIRNWDDQEMAQYIETGFPSPYVYKGR